MTSPLLLRARAVGVVLLKGVLGAVFAVGVGALTVALSVVASVSGLSPLLVAAALAALLVLKIRQTARAGYTPYRSWRAFAITGLVVIGFFVVISVVAAYWPK